MAAIAVKAGAPIGSVYHRFDSRNAILARAWLRVKSDFREEVASRWLGGDTWAGVHGLLDWCRRKPVYARFLLQCADSPDFSSGLSEELLAAVEEEQAALDACFVRCAEAMPATTELDLDHMLLKFVLIDAPVAVVKPYLTQERPIPASVDAMLRASHDAVRGWAAHTTH